jgi:hypothetical protein
MTSRTTNARTRTPSVPDTQKLLKQYGCGPIQFTGTADARYERHLLFDNVVDPPAVGVRERYEAVARSVRDVLSQRWVRTEKTYERLNPKRVYYLSMEFLIGRSLANNTTVCRSNNAMDESGWKSRPRSAGRPPLDLELRTHIRRMARENPTWGRRRIQAELRFLGYEVAELGGVERGQAAAGHGHLEHQEDVQARG